MRGRGGTTTQLCRLIAEVIGVEESVVDPQTGPGILTEWDSLGHMQIVAAIEETYGVQQLSIDEIVNLLSVSDIAALLQDKGINVD